MVDRCSFVSACSSMSQARVTDFYGQRKKRVDAGKQRLRVSARSRAVRHRDGSLRSSLIHEEFVRVIDEAAGLCDGQTGCDAPGGSCSSPRTPKRTSAGAEFDLGAAAFSATADHSTAKKRRPAEAAAPEKVSRRTARKKLVLPRDASEVKAHSPHGIRVAP